MKIFDMNIEELIEYENNPRKNEGTIDVVANSIKEFGFKVPIVIDKNNVIITGHTRLKAAKKLGMEKVPCLIADDLTEDQIKAFRLVDNKTSEFANWDFELLNEELMNLNDLDMTKFGFENIEDIDIDDFFEEKSDEQKEKEPKQIQCPHCGEWFVEE